MNRTTATSPMPTPRLWITFSVVTFTRSVRWLKTRIVIPLGRMPDSWISLSFFSTPLAVGTDFSYFLIKTMPSMTSSSSRPRTTLPPIISAFVSRPTFPSLGRLPTITLAISPTLIGTPPLEAITTFWMSSSLSVSITRACSTWDGTSGSIPSPRRPMART